MLVAHLISPLHPFRPADHFLNTSLYSSSHVLLPASTSTINTSNSDMLQIRMPSSSWLALLLIIVFVVSACAAPLPGWISQRIKGIRWLFEGPQILARRYQYGVPFFIQSPERRYVVISSAAQVRELSAKCESDFSLVEVAIEVFSPQHTMNGVEMTGLAMHRRLLRKMSLALPSSTPKMQKLIEHALESEMAISSSIIKDGWTSFSSMDMAIRLISRANAVMFCGDELVNDMDFVKSALRYSNDVVLAAEAARLVPDWLKSSVAYVITKGHRSSKEVISKLTPVLRGRLVNSSDSERRTDYLQGIIDSVPEDSEDRPSKIISHLLALWFASIHQPAITLLYVLHDLCAHPEYVEALRSEAVNQSEQITQGRLSDLSLLDSFIKESTRMHTFETVSLRRKSMRTQQMLDGTTIQAGDWVCAPQSEIMNDPAVFTDPTIFNGFRFVKNHPYSSYTGSAHRLTDMHPDYLFWGLGKQSCPGRFYTSHILKLSVLHIITNFELASNNPTPRTFNWRSMRVPLGSNKLSIKRRSDRN